ncbi:MAG: hypothetical protein EG825_17585, partial [Rhodocyclaceae bacterium]|nr:hypothetical protein [Rhodocyclaceae bacterium]
MCGEWGGAGFEWDLYDGDLFLIGDSKRLVQVRKIVGSETGVIDKTLNPVALNGERGSILGLWTANRPKEYVELVFRQDGEFRLKRCTNGVTSYDYGLYAVDMTRRSLVYDSRLAPIQSQRLDFYGDTLTIHGGTDTTPCSYTVNLGSADAAIAASLGADEVEAQINAQWLARVSIGPRDPNANQMPELTVDPNPGQVFEAPTVFSQYRLYRRLIPLWFAVVEGGQMSTVVATDTREWHFLANGRVLVRFRIWNSDGFTVSETILDAWGAYGIEPKPTETDIFHCYADNGV